MPQFDAVTTRHFPALLVTKSSTLTARRKTEHTDFGSRRRIFCLNFLSESYAERTPGRGVIQAQRPLQPIRLKPGHCKFLVKNFGVKCLYQLNSFCLHGLHLSFSPSFPPPPFPHTQRHTQTHTRTGCAGCLLVCRQPVHQLPPAQVWHG